MREPPLIRSRQSLFVSGTHGYHTFRIPVLAQTRDGTLLAFAEARRDSAKDWGEIDLVLRRSRDGLRFESLQVVVTEAGMTCGNPAVVVDASTGVIWLLFCKNRADQPEKQVFEGSAQRTVWACFSADDGQSFSQPVEIGEQVKPVGWTWYATGPGRGVCLQSGRLVVPCDHTRGITMKHSDPVRSHVILSDDHGATWRVGGVIDVPGSSECAVVELAPDQLYLDFRNDVSPNHRGGAWSQSGAERFERVVHHPSLADPGCRGGLDYSAKQGALALTHPKGKERRNLVLELSHDSGETFAEALSLEAGPAAYSDLMFDVNGRLWCLTETGVERAYERLDLIEITFPGQSEPLEVDAA